CCVLTVCIDRASAGRVCVCGTLHIGEDLILDAESQPLARPTQAQSKIPKVTSRIGLSPWVATLLFNVAARLLRERDDLASSWPKPSAEGAGHCAGAAHVIG